MSASKFAAALAFLVAWELSEQTRSLAQVTRAHVGDELRVLLHGDLLAHPLIVDEVTNGRLSIGPWTSESEARTLALRLKPVRRSGP